MTLKDLAKTYLELGLNVVPLKTAKRFNNTKSFIPIPYEKYRTNRFNIEYDWPYIEPEGLMFITGAISDLTIIDIDSESAASKLLELTKAASLHELSNYIIKTSKGYQLFYRYTENIKSVITIAEHLDILNNGRQTFALTCNPGYSNYEGSSSDIESRAAMPECLKELLQTFNTDYGLNEVSKSFNFGITEMAVNQIQKALGADIEQFNNSEVIAPELLNTLSHKICGGDFKGLWLNWGSVGKRHEYLKYLVALLYNDKSVSQNAFDNFIYRFAFDYIKFEAARDYAEVNAVLRWAESHIDFQYDVNWRTYKQISDKAKKPSFASLLLEQVENSEVWFCDPRGSSSYYVFNYQEPMDELNPIKMDAGSFKAQFKRKTGKAVALDLIPECYPVFDITSKELFFKDTAGRWRFNKYQPSQHIQNFELLPTIKELPKHWDVLFDNLSGNNAEVKRYLLNELNTLIQMPQHGHTTDVFRGPGGVGKSLYFDILEEIFGQQLCVRLSAEQFVGNFDAMMRDKLIVIVDEVKERDAKLQLKHKMIVGNSKITTTAKYKDTVESKNYVNLFMSTNSTQSILSQDNLQRRDNEFDTGKTKLAELEPFNQMDSIHIGDFLKSDINSLLSYLKSLPLDLALFTKTIHTETAKEISSFSKDLHVMIADALLSRDADELLTLAQGPGYSELEAFIRLRGLVYIPSSMLAKVWPHQRLKILSYLTSLGHRLKKGYNKWEKKDCNTIILDTVAYAAGPEIELSFKPAL